MSDNRPWWNHGSIQDDASSSRRVQGNDEDRKQPRGGYLYYKCARCHHTVLLQVPTPNVCVCDGGNQVSPGSRGSTAVRSTQWFGTDCSGRDLAQ